MTEKELQRYPFFIRVGLMPELKANKITNLLVKRDDSKRDQLIKTIKDIPDVSRVWFTDHERFDLLLEVEVTSELQAEQIISKLKSVQGVTEAEEDINTIKMY
jgi:DNA-binding Lrp family transcriptional regulator